MPRIAGVEIPGEKIAWVGLGYIFGIGDTTAKRILAQVGVNPWSKIKELPEDVISRINTLIDKQFTTEGALRRQIAQNIQRLKEIQCYRGARHRRGLPVRGQRTRSNARTRKGPRKTVAGKKLAKGVS